MNTYILNQVKFDFSSNVATTAWRKEVSKWSFACVHRVQPHISPIMPLVNIGSLTADIKNLSLLSTANRLKSGMPACALSQIWVSLSPRYISYDYRKNHVKRSLQRWESWMRICTIKQMVQCTLIMLAYTLSFCPSLFFFFYFSFKLIFTTMTWTT